MTIDGADARDFDDAVCARAKPVSGWTLWVAIADVAHYVRPGSALDAEGTQAGRTSVYFPNRVIPMLPPELSEDLCSLRPDLERKDTGLRNAARAPRRDAIGPVLIRHRSALGPDLTYSGVEQAVFKDQLRCAPASRCPFACTGESGDSVPGGSCPA